ncbi:MAG: AtpZ/AtpI family protein [Candidatus Bruticola sp.]
MDKQKETSYSQELSAEELEAIFSGPPLADTISFESGEADLDSLAEKLLHNFDVNIDLSSEISVASGEKTDSISAEQQLEPTAEKVVSAPSALPQQGQLGASLSAQLSSMAVSASDIAARRMAKSEYEVNTFAASPEKKAEIASLVESDQNKEEIKSAVFPSDSPEALRERIKAYQGQSREKNIVAQSLGIVFSFGFTVAAVIMAFWWLGRRATEYIGQPWPFYSLTILGVLVGLYSGALVLKPFLKGTVPLVPSKTSPNIDLESGINKLDKKTENQAAAETINSGKD